MNPINQPFGTPQPPKAFGAGQTAQASGGINGMSGSLPATPQSQLLSGTGSGTAPSHKSYTTPSGIPYTVSPTTYQGGQKYLNLISPGNGGSGTHQTDTDIVQHYSTTPEYAQYTQQGYSVAPWGVGYTNPSFYSVVSANRGQSGN